ncbi:MAG: glycosyltransferase family 4 protein [Elainella sp. Prado103]|nr:glycosyltransferase family 4 protein [Elainella sp. Prado103]
MSILFLDQSGELGGAELCLVDLANSLKDRCLVGLFADGAHYRLLQQMGIPAQVLTTKALPVSKESGVLQGLGSLRQLIPLVVTVANLSRQHQVIYANTQKALVVGGLASMISQRPLVFHLHDILSADHFSATNRRIAIMLANHFAALVIANSEASRDAFIQAGGKPDRVQVVYNGFDPQRYQVSTLETQQLRQQLGLSGQFVVGHFSRLSPWKGQHILIEALTHCPNPVTVLLVGSALFGENAYVKQLHQQIAQLGLMNRVRFLGFRTDVPQLMSACDLIAHTSTAPEPFGRVIIEAMLVGRPVVAAAAGGAVELLVPGETGWLTPPADPQELAAVIQYCFEHPDRTAKIAQQAHHIARERFDLKAINHRIDQLLEQVVTI